MGYILAVEMWVATISVAGAIGWILGDLRAGSEDQSFALDDEGEQDGLFTLSFRTLSEAAPACRSPRRESETRHAAQPHALSLSDERMAIFASMPPLAEHEAQVRAIRAMEPVWDTPQSRENLAVFMRTADLKSLEALSHYRDAIDRLNQNGASHRAPHQEDNHSPEASVIIAADPIDTEAFFEGLERHLRKHEAIDGEAEGERVVPQRIER